MKFQTYAQASKLLNIPGPYSCFQGVCVGRAEVNLEVLNVHQGSPQVVSGIEFLRPTTIPLRPTDVSRVDDTFGGYHSDVVVGVGDSVGSNGLLPIGSGFLPNRT